MSKTTEGINHENLKELRQEILKLRDGFAIFDNKEKDKKDEEFKIAFLGLISEIEKAQKNGSWRKRYFNLFKTLEIQWREDVHSGIIAWLLDPEETHGLGEEFLCTFIRKIFNKELSSYSPIKVIRESQECGDRPDIVVEGNNWWLLIENKIKSDEQDKQTIRYASRWKNKGIIGENIFLVYLSPSGLSPESPDFKPVSYRTILELLENMHFQDDSNIFIRNFIDHIYMDLEE